MSGEIAIVQRRQHGIDPLCDSCRVNPWGDEGWKDFFSRETYRTHLKWMSDDDALKRVICYEITPETFYKNVDICSWCALLKNKFGLPGTWEDVQQYGLKPTTITLEFWGPPGVEPDLINAIDARCILSGSERMWPFHTRFSVFSRYGGPANQAFLSPRDMEPNKAGFDQELAKQWITACKANHASCKDKGEAPCLPTRILELVETDDPAMPAALLRDSRPEESGEYACLSYTWGRESRPRDFAKLARSAYSSSIAPDSLPAVFRDAIRVAHGLGLKYLWIDAMCIWQDDSEDLQRELSVIHRYYSEATLVIQTSGTSSVDEGFLDEARISAVAKILQDDEKSEAEFFQLPFLSEKGEEDVLYLAPIDEMPSYDADAEPAAMRGWILQEQNLCRRLLTFPSTGGMIFRCDGNLWGTQDGNVNYHLEDGRKPKPWAKESLTKPDDFPEGITYIPFNGRLLAMINQVRKLAELGNRPELHMVGLDASIQINVKEDDDMTEIDSSDEVFRIIPIRLTVTANLSDGTSISNTIPPTQHPFLRMLSRGKAITIASDAMLGCTFLPGVVGVWNRLVTDYSRRMISYPSDKLIAMAALARNYADRYGDSLGAYSAGLWANVAGEGLLWYVAQPREPPSEYRAPSWSWGAVDGARYTDPENENEGGADLKKLDVEVLHVECTPAEDSPPLGAVVSGYMKVQGKLLDAYWGPSGNEEEKKMCLYVSETGDEQVGDFARVWADHVGVRPTTRELVRMLLVRRYVTGIGHNQDHRSEALLLKEMETGGEKYVRVGFVKTTLLKFHDEWEQRFSDATISLL